MPSAVSADTPLLTVPPTPTLPQPKSVETLNTYTRTCLPIPLRGIGRNALVTQRLRTPDLVGGANRIELDVAADDRLTEAQHT